MGPEIVLIAISYNVAAALAVLLIGGIAWRRARRVAAVVLVIALSAGLWGYLSAPPDWEWHLSLYLFAVAGVIATVIALLWALGTVVIRRITNQRKVGHAV